MPKKKLIINRHHISYDPEVVVKIWKGEHMLITRMGWRKNISKGFIRCLKKWIKENECNAKDLDLCE